MKRLFIALLAVFMLLSFSVTCYAANTVQTTETTESATEPTEVQTQSSDDNDFEFGQKATLTKKTNTEKNAPVTFWSVTMTLLKGFGTTSVIFGLTLLAAIPLGLIITLGSKSKIWPLSFIVRSFVWIIRGTPLLLQILVLVYGPGLVFHVVPYENFVGVMIAFIINYACYFSEIYRGGIESIPKGQYEAGYVLGMTKTQIFFKVVLLQVIKRIIPPMGNEIITLVKDTSLVRIVGALMFMGVQYKEVLGEAFNYVGVKALIWPLFYSAAFYLVFCGALTILFGYIEKKLDYYKG